MTQSRMQELAEFGQSIWLDYIDRPLLETGKLKNLIAQGLRGMTSNPSIFNQAIGSGSDYDQKISRLASEGKSTFEIYDELTIQDIQEAADQFKDVFEHTKGLDGYVSLEINPKIAHEIDQQIQEGLRLDKKVNRPNVMIKVPSTEAGLKVIEELTAKGVNVNATLIFSQSQYENVAKAYLKGLSRLSESTADLSNVRSVASVFISRIDTAVDNLIDEKLAQAKDEVQTAQLQALKGRAAVANSRIIFEKFKGLLITEQAKQLTTQNANAQRVLWASTGTKNSSYSDVKYVTELITAPTVNTLPEKTLNAFCDHGKVGEAFEADATEATEIIASLKAWDIDTDAICQDLLDQGVKAFEDAFDQLFASIEDKVKVLTSV